MTSAPALAFHPAPAAPTPAPSQIRFPRQPDRKPRTDLPHPAAPDAKMVLFSALEALPLLEAPSQHRQEYPTWLH